MVGPWLDRPYTFRALRKTFGPLWLRCDVCRRYVPLKIGGLQNVDYRTKTFSARIVAPRPIAVIEPIKETSMHDYRLDEVEVPERHPAAVDRLIGRRGRTRVDYPGGELLGREVDGRR